MSAGVGSPFSATPPTLTGSVNLNTAGINTLKLTNTLIGQANPSEFTIYVSTLSELPTPDNNDDILLGNGTTYFITTTIDIGTSRILVNGTSALRGISTNSILLGNSSRALVEVLSFGGTSPAQVYLIDLIFQNGGTGPGVFCNLDEFIGLNLSRVVFTGCDLVVDDTLFVVYTFGLFTPLSASQTSSMIIRGTTFTNIIIVNVGFFGSFPTILLDIQAGAVISNLTVSDGAFFVIDPGTTGIKVNIQSQVLFSFVSFNPFSGAGTFLDATVGTLDQGSNNWQFLSNQGVADSSDHGSSLASPGNTSPATVDLPTGQVWVDVADGATLLTYTLVAGAEKFTLVSATNGQLVYNGVLDRSFRLSGTVALKRVSSPNIDIELGFSINGADPIAGSTVFGSAESGAISIPLPIVVVSLVVTNTIKLMVRNIDVTSPSNDILVIESLLSVFI